MSGAQLSVLHCQRILTVLWLVLGVPILAMAIIATNPGGTFEAHSDEVWQWTTASLVPTLTMMFGALAALELQPLLKEKARNHSVSRFFFALTLLLSATYLLLLAFALLSPNVGTAEKIASLRGWSSFVAIVQIFMGVCIGVFFTQGANEREKQRQANSSAAEPVAVAADQNDLGAVPADLPRA